MKVWSREAKTIEKTECALDRAGAELAAIERQLTTLDAGADAAKREQIAAIRRDQDRSIRCFAGPKLRNPSPDVFLLIVV